ncbi:BAG family molecular chaperone regulator 1-like isoform X2 [Dreissena polymorpha]|uniref:BAG family molecular chaperone regulator 1-like isoform X2 n=1 Tax=Dreissena polymorpha TaxID=45954 RepID=UPI002264F723|nr:BAG family molecular chaperone regulator 1-like isoform X2 [Dreissena polymorpha]
MAAEKPKSLKLQLIHGTNKHDISLVLAPDQAGDTFCVKHLMTEVEKRTQIPPEAQKLIFKGQSLKNGEVELDKIGIKNGVKVMLIGKKPTPVDDKETSALGQVEGLFDKESKKLSEITYELDGIHRGFIDKDKQQDAVKKLQKRMAVVAEHLIKLLEKLDSLMFEESNKGARGKRKTLVDKIQVLLNQIDGLNRGSPLVRCLLLCVL